MKLRIYIDIFEELLIWDYFIHIAQLTSNVDVKYLLDPHKAQSQVGIYSQEKAKLYHSVQPIPLAVFINDFGWV